MAVVAPKEKKLRSKSKSYQLQWQQWPYWQEHLCASSHECWKFFTRTITCLLAELVTEWQCYSTSGGHWTYRCKFVPFVRCHPYSISLHVIQEYYPVLDIVHQHRKNVGKEPAEDIMKRLQGSTRAADEDEQLVKVAAATWLITNAT